MGDRAIEAIRQHVRTEDVLLVFWLVILPIILPPSAGDVAPLRSGPDLLGGLVDLTALCGAAACLGSRPREGVRTGLMVDGSLAYAVGPLFGAVLFALDDTVDKLGLQGGLGWLPIVLAMASGLAAWRLLPPLSAETRRALVTPFILVTSGFFSGFLAGLTDLFDLRFLAGSLAGSSPEGVPFVLTIVLLATLVFYVMFVFAPRQIAEREGSALTWAVRFVVFVVSLSIGTTIQGLRAG